MYLLVGLGNPGQEYSGTRHNAGFEFLNHFAEAFKVRFAVSPWPAKLAKVSFAEKTLILLKPETYMNLSGSVVAGAAEYYNITLKNTIIVHDDLDLPLGRIKIVMNRGAGGHKGVDSIIDHLHSIHFLRVRIGIGRPESCEPVEQYVLSRFSENEQDIFNTVVRDVAMAVSLVVEKGADAAMNKINSGKPALPQ